MIEIIEIRHEHQFKIEVPHNTHTVGLRQDYDQPEETNASDREGVRGHAAHG